MRLSVLLQESDMRLREMVRGAELQQDNIRLRVQWPVVRSIDRRRWNVVTGIRVEHVASRHPTTSRYCAEIEVVSPRIASMRELRAAALWLHAYVERFRAAGYTGRWTSWTPQRYRLALVKSLESIGDVYQELQVLRSIGPPASSGRYSMRDRPKPIAVVTNCEVRTPAKLQLSEVARLAETARARIAVGLSSTDRLMQAGRRWILIRQVDVVPEWDGPGTDRAFLASVTLWSPTLQSFINFDARTAWFESQRRMLHAAGYAGEWSDYDVRQRFLYMTKRVRSCVQLAREKEWLGHRSPLARYIDEYLRVASR
jgi:hypothetical protein